MIVPYRHKGSLSDFNKEELTDLMLLTQKTTALLKRMLKPDGFNVGFNIGKLSGAGFPGHIHVHIVPRWLGDTNFMPVLTQTKVISESLNSLYRRLKSAKY